MLPCPKNDSKINAYIVSHLKIFSRSYSPPALIITGETRIDQMPIKYNLTKYDMLSTRIKKTAAAKKATPQLTREDQGVMLKAVIIASFASGHSWQTYRALTAKGSLNFNNPEIRKEFDDALASKWRLINPFDIVEVSTTNISDAAFSQWLFFNVPKSYHDDYKRAWKALQMDFDEDCDSVERKSY